MDDLIKSRRGRKYIFKSGDDLWNAACEYFQWCEDKPLIKVGYNRYSKKQVLIPIARPFQVRGLCLFLGVNRNWLTRLRSCNNEELSSTATRVYETIWVQNFEGAAIGIFNAQLMSKFLFGSHNDFRRNNAICANGNVNLLVGNLTFSETIYVLDHELKYRENTG